MTYSTRLWSLEQVEFILKTTFDLHFFLFARAIAIESKQNWQQDCNNIKSRRFFILLALEKINQSSS